MQAIKVNVRSAKILNGKYQFIIEVADYVSDHILRDLSLGIIVKGQLIYDDTRTITFLQRKKLYAMFRDIANWSGHYVEAVKDYLKAYFLETEFCLGIEWFSLSGCSVGLAQQFINFVITFAIRFNIPLRQSHECLKDEEQLVYMMCLKRMCIVCGKENADIHHVDRIGIKSKRSDVRSHVGKRVLPLCRTHHIQIENEGDEKFLKDHHLTPLKILTEQIVKEFKICY